MTDLSGCVRPLCHWTDFDVTKNVGTTGLYASVQADDKSSKYQGVITCDR